MNKSLDFIIKTLNTSDNKWRNLKITDLDNSMIIPFTKFNNRTEMIFQTPYVLKEDSYGISTTIISYDPDANFEYPCVVSRRGVKHKLITSDRVINNMIHKLIIRDVVKLDVMPEDYNENYFNYDIHYTIGDFVIVYIDNCCTCILPLDCEYIKKIKEI